MRAYRFFRKAERSGVYTNLFPYAWGRKLPTVMWGIGITMRDDHGFYCDRSLDHLMDNWYPIHDNGILKDDDIILAEVEIHNYSHVYDVGGDYIETIAKEMTIISIA